MASRKPTGGRGGKAVGGRDSYKIAGVDIPWDPNITVGNPKPTPLFPEYDAIPPKPLSKDEKARVAHFRALRRRFHDGPLYTVRDDNARVGKPKVSAAAQFDPFEGMPTYSQKYMKRRRKLPQLDTRKYVLKFFPKELWSTIDPSYAGVNGHGGTAREKRLQNTKIDGAEKDPDAENDEETAGVEVDEDEAAEEVVDDEYDEDDDEGGDYNAEQYFDDGGEDAGDDYDGGEADGGEY